MGYKTINDLVLKGKTVLVRVDFNSMVVEHRVMMSSRIREHSKTLEKLADAGAKVVVLSHQGRPGEDDFIALERHANKIRKLLQKEVSFISWEADYTAAIKSLKPGNILVLDNTRFLEDETAKKSIEEHSKDKFVQSLAAVSDYFVQDALSICHRVHGSVVGFAKHMPCVAGPCLEKELNALEKLHSVKGLKLCVMGGAKPEDSIALIPEMIAHNKAEKFLLGGVVGELFLKAKGIEFGAKEAYFKNKGFLELLPAIKSILEKYSDKIVLPIDLAAEKDGIRQEFDVNDLPIEHNTYDIGKKTIDTYVPIIKSSALCIFNGPVGMFENPHFSIGTQKVLEAMAFSSTYSIIGGGETERSLIQLGLTREDFGHVSLAGKALLQYLAGEKLPGLEILEKN